MKKLLTLLIAITSFALVVPVLAQQAPGGSGVKEPPTACPPPVSRRGMRGAASGMMMLVRLYNPETVTTVKGTVASLGTLPPKSKAKTAMRSAVLKTQQGDIALFLVPDWYLEEQKVSLKAGDEVEVTGSKVTMGKDPKPSIIVKDLKVGGKSVAIRNDRGVPVWLVKPQPGES